MRKGIHCLPLSILKMFPSQYIVTDFYFYFSSSKGVKTQLNTSVFGSLQNFKEDKAKPVRDEYEYVSDDGELKIDEFPIRRKKNTTKRELPCKNILRIFFFCLCGRVLCVGCPKLVFMLCDLQ